MISASRNLRVHFEPPSGQHRKMKVFVVLACLFIYANAVPYNYEIGEWGKNSVEDRNRDTTVTTSIQECHGISCPAGTVACSKTVKTSSDKKTLLTSIQCEDLRGNVLNAATKSAENPFENTQISSFSYTGHFNYGGSGSNRRGGSNTHSVVQRPVFHNTHYDTDQVETFD